MGTFSMRLAWNMGDPSSPDLGVFTLASTREDNAIQEAERLWDVQKDLLHPAPCGFRIHEDRTGDVIHRYDRS